MRKLYGDICCIICHMINTKEFSNWSKDYSKVQTNYLDHRFNLGKTHYFEDIDIVFEGASLVKDDGKHLHLKLKNEMIKAKSMSF